MAIPLIKEPYELSQHKATEKCHFCRRHTLYWHENTNNPVCPVCAKLHKVSELPDYGQKIRAAKRKKSRSKHEKMVK